MLRYKTNSDLNVTLFNTFGLDVTNTVTHCAEAVETEFACVCADDDIILVGGLNRGIEFLSRNKDYVGFTGRAYSFFVPGDAAFYQGEPLIRLREYTLYSNNADSRIERIRDFARSPRCFIFNVLRSNALLISFKTLQNLDDYRREYIFGEILQGFVALSIGKVKYFDFDYYVRQKHSSTKLSHYARMSPTLWLCAPGFDSSREVLETVVRSSLQNEMSVELADKKSKLILLELYERIFRVLLERACANNANSSFLSKLFDFSISRLLGRILDKFKTVVKASLSIKIKNGESLDIYIKTIYRN